MLGFLSRHNKAVIVNIKFSITILFMVSTHRVVSSLKKKKKILQNFEVTSIAVVIGAILLFFFFFLIWERVLLKYDV